MEAPLYLLARALVAWLQALPLTWVARLGRLGGGLAYWLDARHRRVALRNLAMCFGHEQSPVLLRALARENFRRIGENYTCAIKTASMSFEDLRARVEFVGNPRIVSPSADQRTNRKGKPSARTTKPGTIQACDQPGPPALVWRGQARTDRKRGASANRV